MFIFNSFLVISERVEESLRSTINFAELDAASNSGGEGYPWKMWVLTNCIYISIMVE